jgi:hypothetical protein
MLYATASMEGSSPPRSIRARAARRKAGPRLTATEALAPRRDAAVWPPKTEHRAVMHRRRVCPALSPRAMSLRRRGTSSAPRRPPSSTSWPRHRESRRTLPGARRRRANGGCSRRLGRNFRRWALVAQSHTVEATLPRCTAPTPAGTGLTPQSSPSRPVSLPGSPATPAANRFGRCRATPPPARSP